jgi:hypothetical protein
VSNTLACVLVNGLTLGKGPSLLSTATATMFRYSVQADDATRRGIGAELIKAANDHQDGLIKSETSKFLDRCNALGISYGPKASS